MSDEQDKENSVYADLVKCKNKIISDLSKNRIAIVTHRNPDPDGISSAMGFARILKTWNPDLYINYLFSGDISHAQNKTLVNIFDLSMTNIEDVENLNESFDFFITVDTTAERSLPDDIPCLYTIDHHRSETKRAEFTDIRYVGATASIICDYLQHEGIKLQENNEEDSSFATLLLIGIYTDTNDLLSENVADIDVNAYQVLMPFVNRKKLQSVMNYPLPSYYFELRSKLDQPENIRVDNGVFVGGIGYMSPAKRDAIPMMATERARVEDVNTAFVFGIVGQNLEVSVRSESVSADVNSICQKIFGKQFAGGKMGSAAAMVPLGLFAIDSDSSNEVKYKVWEAVKSLLIDKIFHVMSGNA
ncbi:MAG: DHH family phosphoesterase [bacterium]